MHSVLFYVSHTSVKNNLKFHVTIHNEIIVMRSAGMDNASPLVPGWRGYTLAHTLEGS